MLYQIFITKDMNATPAINRPGEVFSVV